MIRILNLTTFDGTQTSIEIEGGNRTIDGTGLTVLPALIDPHVHFRTPGAEHKENWKSGARAAFAGGVTTVFDMPNNTPACTSKEELDKKRALIQEQLELPLRYGLWLGLEHGKVDEVGAPGAVGLKIFMGSSTGSLLVDDEATLRQAWQLAAERDTIISIHAEDEGMIKANHFFSTDPASHSKIRTPEVAAAAVERAIRLTEEFGTRLYLLHLSTQAELDLVRRAKDKGLRVYAETTPHHLFLTTDDYEWGGTRVQVNPPLRDKSDQEAVWEAIHEGIIDTIGSDHAPHTKAEKDRPYGEAPSGIAGIEYTLPLLLNAVHEGRLTLDKVVQLTHTNPRRIFNLAENNDVVIVDRQQPFKVDNAWCRTRCGHTPYSGRQLMGTPVYTVAQGELFDLRLPEWHPEIPAVYDINKTYLENAQEGPFFKGPYPGRVMPKEEEWYNFLGHRVASRIGVAAGPLLNSKWIGMAARLGWDVVTYKTTRTYEDYGHGLPNVTLLDVEGQLPVNPKSVQTTERPIRALEDLAITNSFGNPSRSPDYLKKDIPLANAAVGKGQAAVISIFGTTESGEDLIDNFVSCARQAKRAGAAIIEANYSCPNVAEGEGALYQSVTAVKQLSRALVGELGSTPLIIKMGADLSVEQMGDIFQAAADEGVKAVSAINTIRTKVYTPQGKPALGPDRLYSGLCGNPVREVALNWVRQARNIIDSKNLDLTLIGVGGILLPEHFDAFFEAGADFAQVATGIMWDPFLALRHHYQESNLCLEPTSS